jgi:hypothetical protein
MESTSLRAALLLTDEPCPLDIFGAGRFGEAVGGYVDPAPPCVETSHRERLRGALLKDVKEDLFTDLFCETRIIPVGAEVLEQR